MRATIRYNRDFGCWEVVKAGQVIYQTMDRDDAKEYALCNTEG